MSHPLDLHAKAAAQAFYDGRGADTTSIEQWRMAADAVLTIQQMQGGIVLSPDEADELRQLLTDKVSLGHRQAAGAALSIIAGIPRGARNS